MPHILTRKVVDPRVIDALNKAADEQFFNPFPGVRDRSESLRELIENIQYHGGMGDHFKPVENGERIWRPDYKFFAALLEFYHSSTISREEVSSRRINPGVLKSYKDWFLDIGRKRKERLIDLKTIECFDDSRYRDMVSHLYFETFDPLPKSEMIYQELRALGRELTKVLGPDAWVNKRAEADKRFGEEIRNQIFAEVSERVFVPRKYTPWAGKTFSELFKAIESGDMGAYRLAVRLHEGFSLAALH